MRFPDFLHALWHVTHPGQSCDDPTTTVITDVALQRQMLYDAYGEPEEIAQIMGLPGSSESGAQVERAAHIARLENLVPVMPLLLGQADFLATTATALQIQQLTYEPESEEIAQLLIALGNIIRSAIVSSVSTAVGLGVLELNKEVTIGE